MPHYNISVYYCNHNNRAIVFGCLKSATNLTKLFITGFSFFVILVMTSCTQTSNLQPPTSDSSIQILLLQQQQLNQFINFAKKGNLDELKLIYSQNININKADQFGRVAIIEAIKFNQFKILEFLINKQANVNIHVNNMSPLMWAAYHNNIFASQALIKAGANVNDINSSSWTALHYAALLGRTEITLDLLNAGANINSSSDTGMTALMKTAGLNHINNLKILLEFDSKIEKSDNKGRTALMYAAAMGRIEAFRLLTLAGANLAAVDNDGKTALKLAEERKKQAIISYFNQMNQRR